MKQIVILLIVTLLLLCMASLISLQKIPDVKQLLTVSENIKIYFDLEETSIRRIKQGTEYQITITPKEFWENEVSRKKYLLQIGEYFRQSYPNAKFSKLTVMYQKSTGIGCFQKNQQFQEEIPIRINPRPTPPSASHK